MLPAAKKYNLNKRGSIQCHFVAKAAVNEYRTLHTTICIALLFVVEKEGYNALKSLSEVSLSEPFRCLSAHFLKLTSTLRVYIRSFDI